MSYFNLRVYGLLINEKKEILISDELEKERTFSKFPGGGVELGEGLIEALKREFVEECEAEIEVITHFYTTDFYEKSSFNDSQVVSIYYLVKSVNDLKLNFKTSAFDFDDQTLIRNQCFRWVALSDLTEDEVTFRTDQTVVRLLKESINNER